MKNAELLNEFVQWDVRTWSKALRYWETKVDWTHCENSLELGAREGGLSLWLAMKQKKVLCSDYEKAEETALPLHTKYKVLEWVQYEDIDATQIPYENEFDLIVMKSIVGGIGRFGGKEAQEKVFNSIHKALKPGGVLLFAENLASSKLHQRLRKKFNAWGDYWLYPTLTDMHGFLSPFTSYTINATGFLGTFGRSEKQKRVFSVLDDLGPNFLFPASWKYLGYGIAVK